MSEFIEIIGIATVLSVGLVLLVVGILAMLEGDKDDYWM